MEFIILLYITLCILIIIILWLSALLFKYKEKNESLQRKMKIKTDYEKLVYIADIYKSVNFNKLRPDQLKLWDNWVYNNLT